MRRASTVKTDAKRDDLLTDFGKDTLRDRYLLPGESYQDLFARVASAYADDAEHAQRIYDYISKLWFMPATPVLSNGGTGRGLPITCYLNTVDDSLEGIVGTWNENVWLASNGGGIGTYWGGVRGIGEPVGLNGKTSGIIPFVRVMDSLTLAISQGSLRRGSAACYLDISHPGDRGVPRNPQAVGRLQPQGAEPAPRRAHHRRVHGSGARRRRVRPALARRTARSAARSTPARCSRSWSRPACDRRALHHLHRPGEPVDAQASARPGPQGLDLEPLLGDHAADRHATISAPSAPRSAASSSLNLETWDEWNGDKQFIEDVMRFLDNVLQDYIARAPDEMARAKYSARARALGRPRRDGLPLASCRRAASRSKGAMAKSWNLKIFKHIRAQVDEASMMLAKERGPAPTPPTWA